MTGVLCFWDVSCHLASTWAALCLNVSSRCARRYNPQICVEYKGAVYADGVLCFWDAEAAT
jgi:hypothetical protein